MWEGRVSGCNAISGLCTIVVEHDVLRLQVSIDDALLVEVTQCHRDLSQVETVKKSKTPVNLCSVFSLNL